MLEKQKYLRKKTNCWRNRNVGKKLKCLKKKLNVGEIEIFRKKRNV